MPAPERNWTSLRSFMALMACLAMGIFLGLVIANLLNGEVDMQWVVASLLALTLPFLLIMSRNVKRFLISVITIAIPLNIDMTLNLAQHAGGARGFIVSMHNFAVIGLLFIWLAESGRRPWKGFRSMRLFLVPLAGLLVMALISMLKSREVLFSVYEIVEWLKMSLVFFCVARYVHESGDNKTIAFFLIIGLLLESVLALSQYLLNSTFGITALGMRREASQMALDGQTIHRVSGTLGGTNALAWYLDFALPIPIAMLLSRKTGWTNKPLLGLITILGTAALFLTFSRAGWISFVFSLVVLFIAVSGQIKPLNRFYGWLFISGVVLLAAVVLAWTDNPLRKRMTQDDRGSAYVRLPLMKVAAAMIRENPWTGVGLNNYVIVDQEYDETEEQVSATFPLPVHNVYLQLPAETGLPALGFFLSFAAMVFLRLLRILRSSGGIERILAAGLLAGLSGFMLHGTVENASIGSYHFLPFWFVSGWTAGMRIPDATAESETGMVSEGASA
ncbi:O-antigen ligase family protein [bacterium]|nr:O-antigen ligase family protein [bacterium]